jgi:hypothetical protein
MEEAVSQRPQKSPQNNLAQITAEVAAKAGKRHGPTPGGGGVPLEDAFRRVNDREHGDVETNLIKSPL